MEPRYIPKYLDAQPQFLWWEIDEAFILFGSLIIGRMLDRLILFLIIGFVFLKLYNKLKSSKQDGFMIHFFYRLGLVKFKSNTNKSNKLPHYYIKYFIK